ncbi:MAG TPA: heparinase II/III family protein [Vicinamibacterales bacterium]|nr:heparinase II/III family protein [Vicinamibacterales bacterium]
MRGIRATFCAGALLCVSLGSPAAHTSSQSNLPAHPRLLFTASDLPAIRQRATVPILQPVARRLIERADRHLHAPPLVPSITKRGEPDPPGEQKGLACARALQGRVLTLAMAFTLTGDRKYRDAAVAELRHAIDDWRIWVDTAHAPPFDLMNGELCLTFGLAYDWLYNDLTPDERRELRTGVERRGLKAYVDAVTSGRPTTFYAAKHNWNPVCNGGAAVLALALEGESDLSTRVLELAVPAMDHYWNHLADDGGWDEGTGYWTYGHRYAFMAADALRRSGRRGGAERFALPGARATGYFPIVFNPGKTLTAGFGDSNSRVSDPLLYLLGREYRNPDFIWFQDRARVSAIDRDGWPEEALTLLWRPAGEPWLPENRAGFAPSIAPTTVFPSIGWAMMTPAQPDPPFFLALKNGSLAANHTHLDLNHVNVGVGNAMLLAELGSRPYPADYFGANRYNYYELTTAGHNTVLIGGRGQVRGKAGTLIGPTRGPRFEEIVGVADNAYEQPATRARRHVVFVDRRYWVLLDEIQTPQPEQLELRFHTSAAVQELGPGRWRYQDGDNALELASPQELTSSIETPSGWIRPFRVLSLKTRDALRDHAIVTVLQPQAAGSAAPSVVSVKRSGNDLLVTVGRDRATFRLEPDGWHMRSAEF